MRAFVVSLPLGASLLDDGGGGGEAGGGGVTLTTVHQAKGLEWAAVVLPALEDGIFPHARRTRGGERRRRLAASAKSNGCSTLG